MTRVRLIVGGESSSERVSPKTRRQKMKKRIQDIAESTGPNLEIRKSLLDKDLLDKSTVELRSMRNTFLNGIEGARAKSSNIKGELSGRIKVNVGKIKDLVEVFAVRLDERGDAVRFKELNIELSRKLDESKIENAGLKYELESLNWKN